jgi:hypothetical protein
LLPILNENHHKEREECEGALELLCKEYGINQIHFTNIIGRNSLGKRRRDFLQKYTEIVCTKKAWSISFSMDRSAFVDLFSLPQISDKELYFNLFWNAMEKVADMLPMHSIFHIQFELDNNLSVTLGKEYVGRLYNGLNQCQPLKDKQDSVCKYPSFFSKKALFYSSLADLAAYSNTVLQQKLDSGIPITKIKKNHGELIETLRQVFRQSTSLHQLGKDGTASLVLGEL